jgi:hypothetical protein
MMRAESSMHLEAKYVVAGFSPRPTMLAARTRAKARDYILEANIQSWMTSKGGECPA